MTTGFDMGSAIIPSLRRDMASIQERPIKCFPSDKGEEIRRDSLTIGANLESLQFLIHALNITLITSTNYEGN